MLFETKRYRVEFQAEGPPHRWNPLLRTFEEWYSAYYIVDLATWWSSVDEVRVIPDRSEELSLLIKQWLDIGRKNPWIKTAYDPPFNPDSLCVCYTVDELEERITGTAWSIGTAFVYRDLCFINQIEVAMSG